MTVSIENPPKEFFRPGVHRRQPVKGHQPARIGIGVSKGKSMALQILKPVKGALFINDQVGGVSGLAMDFRDGQEDKADIYPCPLHKARNR